MIVNACETGWQVVYQAAHGLLAGALAMHFRSDLQSVHWCETLAAIIQHDDCKVEAYGRARLTPAGAPLDFTELSMTDEERSDESARRLATAFVKHRWLGLLQSQHIECLYAGQPVNAVLKRLLASECKRRQQVLRELKVEAYELEYAYQLLHWCDRCSLILAQQQLPAMQRRVEIIHALTDETYTIAQREDDSLAVDPWPFAEDEFQVAVEYRLLDQLSFSSEEQLQIALEQAPVRELQWKLRY